MTWFDLIVFLTMGSSILLAAYRGVSQEITTLLALVAAAFLAFWLAGPLGKLSGLNANMLTNMSLIIFLFALFFILSTAIMNMMVGKFLGTSRSKIDRLIGGLFGFIRGWVIIGLAFLALQYYFEPGQRPEALSTSISSEFAEAGANILEGLGLRTTSLPQPNNAEENDESAFLMPSEIIS